MICKRIFIVNDTYAHYCRTIITNKYVGYWMHRNAKPIILTNDIDATDCDDL